MQQLTTITKGKRAAGTAQVILQSAGTNLDAFVRTPTQTDMTNFGVTRLTQIPGDFILHQEHVGASWNRIQHVPKARVLEVSKSRKVRVFAATKDHNTPWTHQADINIASAVVAKGDANVLILPSKRNASKQATLHRLNAIRAYAKSKGWTLRITIGLDLLSDAFPSTFDALAGTPEVLIAVECTGYKGALSNLDHVGHVVSTAPEPPFVMGYSGERWARGDPNRAAATIFLRRFGFQTLAPRVYQFGGNGGKTAWFDRRLGGYVTRTPTAIHGPAGVAGIKPNPKQSLSKTLQQRRFDETWQYIREHPLLTNAVEQGSFGTYRQRRSHLDKTLTKWQVA